MHRNLIVDLNNLIFMTRFAKIKTPTRSQRREMYVKELIFKEAISYICRAAVEHKCNAILVTCESKKVWRKDIYAGYKDKDSEIDIYYDDCLAAADLVREFFTTCTNASVVDAPRSEADDIIGVFCSESDGVENVILSSDKDFIQLLSPTTKLYSPVQKTFRESDDTEYDLFVKVIRGDSNDCVPSAFPRVRETRLKKAYEDPYEMQNLMETVLPSGDKVADLYKRNRTLIDLSAQPDYIKVGIRDVLSKPRERAYSEFKIMKFYADVGLKGKDDDIKYQHGPLKGFVRWKTV